jgi:hypothetical protein
MVRDCRNHFAGIIMTFERPFSLERLPHDPDAGSIAIMTTAIRSRWSEKELAKRLRADYRQQAVVFPMIVVAPAN